MAKYAKKVYGVEIVEQAIKDAKENAKTNNIEKIQIKYLKNVFAAKHRRLLCPLSKLYALCMARLSALLTMLPRPQLSAHPAFGADSVPKSSIPQ